MAKKKKKQSQARSLTTRTFDISHTQQERCYVAAKKLLSHFDFDPDLLDTFSKKQRQILLQHVYDPPSIKPEKENTVPRQYINKINAKVFHFMKTNYFGNPDNQLTYMELAIYGLGFFMVVLICDIQKKFVGTPQEELARQIAEKFKTLEVFNDGFKEVFDFIRYNTSCYSQVNFRLYGFHFQWTHGPSKVWGLSTMKLKILLTAHNCEYKMFTYNKIERKAFRLILSANGLIDPSWAVFRRNKIFPDAKEDKYKEDDYFSIYIQSHALYRFKERVDIFDPADRNYLIQHALTRGQHVAKTDKYTFLSCLIGDCPIGYFTFFVRGDDLIVNTFLPLASENTPEGKKLHELLPLNKEDIIYLGMDKISFYTQVDFEQIPILKQALIKSGIWQSKLAIDNTIDEESLEEGETPVSQQKTQFVKTFFDKYELHRANNILLLHDDDTIEKIKDFPSF